MNDNATESIRRLKNRIAYEHENMEEDLSYYYYNADREIPTYRDFNKNTRCILKNHQGVNQYTYNRKVPFGRKDRAIAQEPHQC